MIGNPPYVNIEKISKSDKAAFLNIYGEEGKLGKRYDLYQIFIMRGIKLIRSKGILTFILPNTFLMGSSYTILRKRIINYTSILRIVNLPQNVFKSAMVDNVLLFLKKDISESKYNSTKINILTNKSNLDKLIKEEWDESFDIEQNLLEEEDKFKINIHLTPELKNLFAKMENTSLKLGTITESSQGIIIYKTKKDSEEDLYTSFKNHKGWKKLLRGKNIGLYQIKWNGEYIYYGDWLWSQRDQKYFENPENIAPCIEK